MNRPTESADLLAAAAKLIYTSFDTDWLNELATDLDIDVRTLRAWLSGKRALQPNNTVMTWAANELEKEAKILSKLADRIRRNAAEHKPTAPTRREKVDA